jgi:hypothetical protein
MKCLLIIAFVIFCVQGARRRSYYKALAARANYTEMMEKASTTASPLTTSEYLDVQPMDTSSAAPPLGTAPWTPVGTELTGLWTSPAWTPSPNDGTTTFQHTTPMARSIVPVVTSTTTTEASVVVSTTTVAPQVRTTTWVPDTSASVPDTTPLTSTTGTDATDGNTLSGTGTNSSSADEKKDELEEIWFDNVATNNGTNQTSAPVPGLKTGTSNLPGLTLHADSWLALNGSVKITVTVLDEDSGLTRDEYYLTLPGKFKSFFA